MATTPTQRESAQRERRWTRLEHDERRRQILSCAARLFSGLHYGAVSTTEIAREAGVTRGLLHHYFGTKRELYLEVVRSLLQLPPDLFPEGRSGRDPEELLRVAVDRWLEMARRNRETYFAIAGLQGFGRDPELEAILEEAREAYTQAMIALLRPDSDPSEAPRELRAMIRAYAGFVESATLDWLKRRTLTRAQVGELLVHGALQLHRQVLPLIERARD